jgi:hypothetical protein
MEAPVLLAPAPAWRARVFPTVLAAMVLMVCGLGVRYAFYTTFASPLSLDEGYLMITVQSFLEGEPLYDSVFTQYGPVYYAYQWVIHRALAIPLTHDATRFLCMFHWLAAAALLGLAGARITRSALGALFIFMQAIVHLKGLANEPGHPQELIAVLLAGGVLVALETARWRARTAALALVGTLLFFIKINIGTFFFFALFAAMLWCLSNRFQCGTLVWLFIAGGAVMPFVLMRDFIAEDWCRNYALLVASAWVAAAMTAKHLVPNVPNAGWRPWLVVAAVGGVTAVACLAIAIVAGSSLHGLLDGIVLTPLRLTDAAVWPLHMPNIGLLSPIGSLVLAAFLSVRPEHPRRPQILIVFKAVFGITACVLFVSESHAQLKYLVPWMWLVMPMDQRHNESFARVFIALSGLWQSLQAYPIAGTQVTVATLFVPLAGTVCLGDALRGLHISEWLHRRTAHWRPIAILAGQSAAAAAIVMLFALVWCGLPALRRHYASLPALELPGSARIHNAPATVHCSRALAHYLETNCDTFLTTPGMNSYYFWAHKRPPTHVNPTTFSILTMQQEENVISALNRAKRPLIVAIEGTVVMDSENRPVLVGNEANAAPTDGPLPLRPFMRTLRNEYAEVHRIPPFKIYAPKQKPPSAPP